MNGLLERRGDTIALAAGLVLGIIVIGAYVIGVTAVAQDLDSALDPDQAAAPAPVYDLEAAQQLNLKGLTPGR